MHYFGVKTLSETLFPPPLMKAGDGARQLSLALAQIRRMMTLGEGMWAG